MGRPLAGHGPLPFPMSAQKEPLEKTERQDWISGYEELEVIVPEICLVELEHRLRQHAFKVQLKHPSERGSAHSYFEGLQIEAPGGEKHL